MHMQSKIGKSSNRFINMWAIIWTRKEVMVTALKSNLTRSAQEEVSTSLRTVNGHWLHWVARQISMLLDKWYIAATNFLRCKNCAIEASRSSTLASLLQDSPKATPQKLDREVLKVLALSRYRSNLWELPTALFKRAPMDKKFKCPSAHAQCVAASNWISCS